VRVTQPTDSFRAAMKARYRDLPAFNKAHRSRYADWSQVPMAASLPKEEAWRLDWTDFVTSGAPAQYLSLVTPEVRYHQWLEKKYRTVAGLNQAYGTKYASFDAITAPRYESDWAEVRADHRAIRRSSSSATTAQRRSTSCRTGGRSGTPRAGGRLAGGDAGGQPAWPPTRSETGCRDTILLFLPAMAFPAEVTMIGPVAQVGALLNTYCADSAGDGERVLIFLLKASSTAARSCKAAILDGASPRCSCASPCRCRSRCWR
jgi:hypothetical protein